VLPVVQALQGRLQPDLEVAFGMGNGSFCGLYGLLESVGGHLSGSTFGIRVQTSPSHREIMTARRTQTREVHDSDITLHLIDCRSDPLGG
jgi:hypothetical protein